MFKIEMRKFMWMFFICEFWIGRNENTLHNFEHFAKGTMFSLLGHVRKLTCCFKEHRQSDEYSWRCAIIITSTLLLSFTLEMFAILFMSHNKCHVLSSSFFSEGVEALPSNALALHNL
ncbi:hypothetical protein ACJX0J_017072 [Zea mays]